MEWLLKAASNDLRQIYFNNLDAQEGIVRAINELEGRI